MTQGYIYVYDAIYMYLYVHFFFFFFFFFHSNDDKITFMALYNVLCHVCICLPLILLLSFRHHSENLPPSYLPYRFFA